MTNGSGLKDIVIKDLKNYIAHYGGYFNEKNIIRAELLGSIALSAARILGAERKTSYTQLRAFFTAARAVQKKYSARGDFEQIIPNIERLEYLVAYYVGKGKGDWERRDREVLKDFIESNVVYAKKDGHNFQDGFMQHFEAVMGYFKWLYPKE
jgi:CRISPR type III-A-associated protein Csm2